MHTEMTRITGRSGMNRMSGKTRDDWNDYDEWDG